MQAMASHASGSRITVLLIVVINTGHFRNFLILTVNSITVLLIVVIYTGHFQNFLILTVNRLKFFFKKCQMILVVQMYNIFGVCWTQIWDARASSRRWRILEFSHSRAIVA